MSDRVNDLETRIDALEQRLDTLNLRLHTLEGSREPETVAETPPVAARLVRDDANEDAEPEPSEWQGIPILAGRTFLVLAGAFLLRALTEADTLSGDLGIGLGLAWAAVWGVMARRAGRGGRSADATSHGIAAILVAFPIVWEGSTRFAALGPTLGAALLAAFALGILGVAWRHGLRLLAFLAVLAASLTSVGLLIAGHSLDPLALVLLPLGAASLGVAWHRGWPESAWPAALAADGVLALLAARFGAPAFDWVQAGDLLSLQAALAVLYLGAFAGRTLVAQRSVGAFEVAQSLAVVGAGFEGAVAVAGGGPPGRWILAILAGAVAAVAWAVSFLRFERREDRLWNVTCGTALGSLLAVEALRLALDLPVAGVLWTILALGLAFAAVRPDRVALRLQVAALVLAGSVATGLVPESIRVLAGKGVPDGPPGWEALACLAATTGALWVLRRHRALHGRSWIWTVPCFDLALVIGLGFAGTAVGLLAGPLAGTGESLDRGALAVLRTGVLSALALGFASLGRRRERAEFRWATFLILGLTAVKVLVEDIPQGRPLTLFLTLAFFGGALIGATRIVRRRGAPRPAVTTPLP